MVYNSFFEKEFAKRNIVTIFVASKIKNSL